MGATQVPQNGTARRTFTIRDGSGNRVAPDVTSPETPVIEEVYLNGAPTALIVPVIAQLTNDATSPEVPVTGTYEISFATNYAGVATGDLVAVTVSATITAAARVATMEFIIDQVSERQPFIDVS